MVRFCNDEAGLYLLAKTMAINFNFLTKLVPVNDDEHHTLRKVLARNVCSSAEWTEANEESNQEQILWAWSQVLRWSKNLYSASRKPIHSGELVPEWSQEIKKHQQTLTCRRKVLK